MSKQKRPRQPAAVSLKRYTRQHPCPICGGYASAQPPQRWCGGRISEDGKIAYCTSMEYAGELEPVPGFIPAPRLYTAQSASPTEGKAGQHDK